MLAALMPPSPATSRKFFFFQAEDGIRDWSVTGVQACALPIAQASGIDDRAAFERFDDTDNAHITRSPVHRSFGARCDIAPLLSPASKAEALSLLRFLARPAERLRCRFQHGPHSCIGKIF